MKFSTYTITLLFIALVTCSSQGQNSNWQQPYAPDANTVALWHFDEGSGTTINDYSGNNYSGTGTNISFSPGQNGFGSTLSFADNPIGYVSFGDFPLPQNEGTFEAWIRPLPRPVTSCDHAHSFAKALDGHSAIGFTFYLCYVQLPDSDTSSGAIRKK